MDDLFDVKSRDTSEYLEKIHDIIEKNYKGNLSNQIKTYLNRDRFSSDYQNYQIKNIVNDYFIRYKNNLDISEKNFRENFQNNYGERVFELVMANFLVEHFKVANRNIGKQADSLPDFEFQVNDKTYLLECTTRDTTLLSDYIKLLPKFELHFNLAETFHKENELLKKSRSGWNYKWWCDIEIIYQQIWISLNDGTKNFIWRKLGFIDKCPPVIKAVHLDEFRKWIFLNNHILCHTPQLLPKIITASLQEIDLTPKSLFNWDAKESYEFRKLLARFIAQGVIDKLFKAYFNGEKPVVLSISLALLLDSRMIQSPRTLFDTILTYLPCTMKEVAFEKCNKNHELELLKNKIKNLYAVIIDTTVYNWFPNVYNAKMQDGYNNHYGVIYNKNISEKIQKNSDPGIFDKIIPYKYSIDLNFN